MRASWRTASRDDLITELERQRREIERLRRERNETERDVDQLRRERDRLRQERDRLRRKIDRLEDELETAAVVARKVCGGNRTARGAQTQQVLASVLRTIQQRQLNASAIFSDLLRASRPISALAPPTSLQ